MKGSKGEATSNIQGKPHMFQARMKWQDRFKVLKGKREKPTTKIIVRGKDFIQNWRNQKLFRQAKVKRIQYHQTSFTTNVKGII